MRLRSGSLRAGRRSAAWRPCRSRVRSGRAGAGRAPAAEKVSPAQVKAAIDLLGSLDFPVRMNAGTDGAPRGLVSGGTRAARGRRHSRRLIRPLQGAGRAVRVHRPPDQATRWSRRSPIGTIGCAPRRTPGSSITGSGDGAAAAGGADEGGVGVREAGADPRARRPRRRSEGPRGHDRARDERPGSVPRRRHRGAGRVQGGATRFSRSWTWRRLEGRCRTTRSGDRADRRQAWAARAGRPAAHRPANLQPSIAAAICLLGSNCGSHLGYLTETLEFAIANPGYQELLRAAAGGLSALAVAGNQEAAAALFERGGPTRDPERAAIALALGTLALRNTTVTLQVLGEQKALEPGHRAAARSLRHARRGSRGGAVLRRGQARLLGGRSRLAGPQDRRMLIQQLEF